MLYFFAFAVFVPCNAVFLIPELCTIKQPEAVRTTDGINVNKNVFKDY